MKSTTSFFYLSHCIVEIISKISNIHEGDSNIDHEEEAVLPIPTSAESSSTFDCLFRSFECNSDIPHDYFKQLQEMKQFLVTSQTPKLNRKK